MSCGPIINKSQGIDDMVNRGGVYVTIYNSIPCSGDTFVIEDELHQFDYELNENNSVTLDGDVSIIGTPVDWTLSNTTVVSGSLLVTDVAKIITYTENVDYTIDYDLGIITRLVSGVLIDGDIINTDYSYHTDCIEEKTGNPNRFCTTCKDPDRGNISTGIIYYQSFTRKALFHIPNYNSDFYKSGVFKLGDGILSFPIGVQIDATGEAGGIFLQDKVKITGVSGIWLVMDTPQTIQMGQFLGLRCHLRKIEL